MASFITHNRHGYSVKFSPFEANRLVVASSQLYGLAGGGTLHLLESGTDETLEEICQFEWTDGIFDVVWSRNYANIVATSSGDGSLQLWNISERDKKSKPLLILREHKNEIYSIDWSRLSSADQILSSSWDGCIKLWDPCKISSISTFVGHTDLIYSSAFSEHIPNVFISPLAAIQAHSGEILTCDWSKYDKNLFATGASDGLIRGWDLRQLSTAVFELEGSEYAVRRIKFSPYSSKILVSANYDFTTRIWDFEDKPEPLETMTNHSEFVCGIDWSLHSPNKLADCGWDSVVNVFVPESLTKRVLD